MKFIHIADCHLGSWREEILRDLSFAHFKKAIASAVRRKVDFVVLAGDLFNTSLPAIDILRKTIRELNKLKEHDIPLYFIAGSHDFSPSGKSMLDVIEEAGLGINVMKGMVDSGNLRLKFTVDKKTGAKITGIIGKRGMLERSSYEQLERESLEKESGFKIFLFHTAINELKPKDLKDIDSAPLSLLPKGFDYYAGGHVHIVQKSTIEGYENIVYPGPLFPNSFSELETLEQGGYYLYDNGQTAFVPFEIPLIKVEVNCAGKSPQEINQELSQRSIDAENSIVLIRAKGKLTSGKPSDLAIKNFSNTILQKGALCVLKNTSLVESEEFQEIFVDDQSVDDVESVLVLEHLGQNKNLHLERDAEHRFTKQLLLQLATEKKEGETIQDFRTRMRDDVKKVISELNL